MALALQEGGISRHRILPWIELAYPFASVRPQRLQELIDTMLERDILYEADGVLSLGQRGERLYGRRNFFELYAVFTAPPVMRVQHGRAEVGYVHALFVSMHDENRGPLCFRLAGRAWQVGLIDWSKGVAARASRRPRSRPELARYAELALDRALPGHARRAPRGGPRIRVADALGRGRAGHAARVVRGPRRARQRPAGGSARRSPVAHLRGRSGEPTPRRRTRADDRRAVDRGQPVDSLQGHRDGCGERGRSWVAGHRLGEHRRGRRTQHGARHGEQVPAVPSGGRRGPPPRRTPSGSSRHAPLPREHPCRWRSPRRSSRWSSPARRRPGRPDACSRPRPADRGGGGNAEELGGVGGHTGRAESGDAAPCARGRRWTGRGDRAGLRDALPVQNRDRRTHLPHRPVRRGRPSHPSASSCLRRDRRRSSTTLASRAACSPVSASRSRACSTP